MKITAVRRWVRLSVGRRLFLTLLPSLFALGLVISLAYYGEYQRQVPGYVVVASAILALISVVGTWLNGRYLTTRISRLAGNLPASNARANTSTSNSIDELDRIEQVVDRMDSALVAGVEERARTEARVEALLHDEATMLAAVVRDAIVRLDDVRLPLHILLEARFGDLNENQEELLATARDATQEMDNALRQLETIANADRGALAATFELVQVNDVVRAVLPLVRMSAERQQARLVVELEPGIPRVLSDRSRLAQAISLLATEAATRIGAETPLRIATERIPGAAGGVAVRIAPVGNSVVADRLLAVIHAEVSRTPEHVHVILGQRDSS